MYDSNSYHWHSTKIQYYKMGTNSPLAHVQVCTGIAYISYSAYTVCMWNIHVCIDLGIFKIKSASFLM